MENNKTEQLDKTSILKKQYVEYFEDVPIQKYAAMFIGRDEDTIIRWRKSDTDFADAVMKSKANWIRKKLISAKAEFVLERLEKELFNKLEPPQEVSTYNQYISSHTIDPNSPSAKELSDKVMKILMDETRVKSSSII
ncbi:MAG: hypothetical protein WC666_04810 [Candidatus Paceibacterota bacterium]|jgi:hypothetical protein